ncbi:hypothetical protein [Mesorhizobium sp. 131-2-1]|uniref:hypothetical protein n=1 Tax=Mesorhizobium sp. 131-2-1 TaxID=2744518 RepID=UPI00192938E0|nr:hypothetical protein [Mesorhizobium sp. 131-2-1]BCG94456.1 hypothetical protein MesoLj131a_33200 [Mesorhizobium sp. 131-2-1]
MAKKLRPADASDIEKIAEAVSFAAHLAHQSTRNYQEDGQYPRAAAIGPWPAIAISPSWRSRARTAF